jgi:hypothetical protein
MFSQVLLRGLRRYFILHFSVLFLPRTLGGYDLVSLGVPPPSVTFVPGQYVTGLNDTSGCRDIKYVYCSLANILFKSAKWLQIRLRKHRHAWE